MNITLLRPPPPSPISTSHQPLALHHHRTSSSPFNFPKTKTTTSNSFVLNSTNPSSLSATSKSEPRDEKLLTLLQQRKTEEAWIAYTLSAHLPNPTFLTRLRNESQLHRLDSNSLGLLAVAAAKAGHTLYASSVVKSMLRSGYLPHVKA
ncbi:unnamed protein product [Lathyrus sativus]|nr:unnamed protein product [Lathyrus sativus]